MCTSSQGQTIWTRFGVRLALLLNFFSPLATSLLLPPTLILTLGFLLRFSWIQANRDKLEPNSDLEFEVHKRQFIELVATNQCEQALMYAQANFAPFKATHLKGKLSLFNLFHHT